jgi:hypothetical protein
VATARRSLELARTHVSRVRHATCTDPADWLDLATYGFYALEAAVVAAASHRGYSVKPSHPSKIDAAEWLNETQGLPAIAVLLLDLNKARKSQAYGDVDFPDGLIASEVAREIERYVKAVEEMLNG